MGSSSNTTNHREERVRARTKKKNNNININKRKMSKEDEEEPRKVEFVLKSNISNNNRKVIFLFFFPAVFFLSSRDVCLLFPRLIVRGMMINNSRALNASSFLKNREQRREGNTNNNKTFPRLPKKGRRR